MVDIDYRGYYALTGWGRAGRELYMSIVPETSRFAMTLRRLLNSLRWRYMALFALAAIAVYWSANAAARRSEPSPSYTATATIVMKTDDHADGYSGLARPDLADIKRQILAESNLRQVLNDCGAEIVPLQGESPKETTARAVAQLRRDLRTVADWDSDWDSDGDSTPGKSRILLTYTSNNGPHTAVLVHGLAESYVGHVRQQHRRRAGRAHAETQEALAYARQDLLTITAERDSFFERHFGQRPVGTRPLDRPPIVEPTPPIQPEPPEEEPADVDPPEEGENPSRAKVEADPQGPRLDDKLAALHRRRYELLADRMPEHPEVKYIESQIAELRHQLGNTPGQISNEAPEEPPANVTPPKDPPAVVVAPADSPEADSREVDSPEIGPIQGESLEALPWSIAETQDVGQHVETVRAYRELQEATDRASQSLQHAGRRERLAWQRVQYTLPIRVEGGQPRRITVADDPPRGIMLASLAAGLVMAAGVGIVSTGASMHPPMTRLEQVEAAIGVPVIGTIEEDDPTVEPVASRRWQPLKRTTLVAAGMLLIGGFVGMLVRASSGF